MRHRVKNCTAPLQSWEYFFAQLKRKGVGVFTEPFRKNGSSWESIVYLTPKYVFSLSVPGSMHGEIFAVPSDFLNRELENIVTAPGYSLLEKVPGYWQIAVDTLSAGPFKMHRVFLQYVITLDRASNAIMEIYIEEDLKGPLFDRILKELVTEEPQLVVI